MSEAETYIMNIASERQEYGEELLQRLFGCRFNCSSVIKKG